MLSYELVLKAAGAVLLFVSTGVWTAKNKRVGKERLRRLRGQIAFVGFVRERIERYLLPISQIIPPIESTRMLCANQQGDVTPSCT